MSNVKMVTVQNLDFFPCDVLRMERKSAFHPDAKKSEQTEKHALVITWLRQGMTATERTVCVFEAEDERDEMWGKMNEALMEARGESRKRLDRAFDAQYGTKNAER